MVDLKIELPEHFLDEEVRCDYLVTHEMKEVWAVELDLLAELLRVCKKYDIKIFVIGGTMLGVARHKGFIPWDDDIDMAMFREDYDKLCKVASQEFVHPYFFQTEYTDKESLRGHAQLRNSDTAGILKAEMKMKFKFNQGIFIDIFPLDNIPDDIQIREKWLKKSIKLINELRNYRLYNSVNKELIYRSRNRLKQFVKRIIYPLFYGKIFNKHTDSYENYEKCIKKFNTLNTENVGIIVLNKIDRFAWKKTDLLAQIKDLPFEFLKVPIPTSYPVLLEHTYGDWKKIVKGTSLHGDVLFDTSKSYLQVLNFNV